MILVVIRTPSRKDTMIIMMIEDDTGTDKNSFPKRHRQAGGVMPHGGDERAAVVKRRNKTLN
jgi:hypothetical protein